MKENISSFLPLLHILVEERGGVRRFLLSQAVLHEPALLRTRHPENLLALIPGMN
jgi:hypothetical protein